MIKHNCFLFVCGLFFITPLSVAQQTLLTKELKNNEPVHIVKLGLEDTDIFAQAKNLFVRSFEDAYKNFTPEQLFLTPGQNYITNLLYAAFEDEESDFINQKDGTFFVVAQNSNDKVVGFVAFDKHVQTDEIKVYIRQLAIDPAYKNKGLGRLLCIDTIKEIIDHKPVNVVVCTRKINEPAIQFYRKLGFKDATMDEVHPELPAYKYCGFSMTLS